VGGRDEDAIQADAVGGDPVTNRLLVDVKQSLLIDDLDSDGPGSVGHHHGAGGHRIDDPRVEAGVASSPADQISLPAAVVVAVLEGVAGVGGLGRMAGVGDAEQIGGPGGAVVVT